MANTRHKFQDPKQFLIQVDAEHFHKNRRSAINYYGEDYRVLHDYVAPRFTLPKKYRR